MPKTLVIGASMHPYRYSYKAVQLLRKNNHEVFALGKEKGKISDVDIVTQFPNIKDEIHTVTLYIRPQLQEPLYNKILGLPPKRIIFNPGTENHTFEKMAQESGIETVRGCTLVMLGSETF